MSNSYALNMAILNPTNGALLSDVYFGVGYISKRPNVMKAFRTYVSELVDVHINEINPDAYGIIASARGINPQSGMIEVYNVQFVGRYV